jgi:alpha-D-ribose 1-methylphosphonate 5-triphosphate diphosphatase
LQITGCEFPVTLAAARCAVENNMSVFMGAPNLIRGTSSNGNLKAAETIRAGFCKGLISDYYPESLLQAPFVAAESLPVNLADALELTTSGPADFLSSGYRVGRLEPGAKPDLVVIDTDPDWKRVTQTWVGGEQTYCSTINRKGIRS